MKEYRWSSNGMKQIINSGYKAFDLETNYISRGNVISNTQYSSYIRPWKEIKNESYIGKEGDFVKFDMQFFKNISEKITKIIYDKTREKSVILYQFSVHGNPIGHVLTTDDHKMIDFYIIDEYKCNFQKRHDAITEAMKYICD